MAVLLVGCAQPRPSLAEIKALPGATAAYPGAVEYGRQERNPQARMDGPTPATILVEACSRQSRAVVAAFFDSTLTSAGWRQDPSRHEAFPGKFVSGLTWVRDTAQFDLNFDTQQRADIIAQAAHRTGSCPTAYQTLVQAETRNS